MEFKRTKGELKRQRDALKMYQRYLPTLQLKKQQLQMEILNQLMILAEKKRIEAAKRKNIEFWAGLLSDEFVDMPKLIKIKDIRLLSRNIAGVDFPLFESVEFLEVEYDLYLEPLWVDAGVEALKELISLGAQISTLERGIAILRQELRITIQRVNLFEKVKIPESEEAIRVIKIYIGDQMANAVGRSKIAKRKIESYELAGVLV